MNEALTWLRSTPNSSARLVRSFVALRLVELLGLDADRALLVPSFVTLALSPGATWPTASRARAS